MTKQLFWTKRVVDTFIEEGNLNPRQQYIILSRAQGIPIVGQAEALNLSVDQVNKEIAALKKLYDVVQEDSDILPARKKNKKQLYDTK